MALFIIVVRIGVLVGLQVIKDLNIWPYIGLAKRVPDTTR
jgi:hypothetical protein